MVNTMWSLKALDFHVISDGEIIEDVVTVPRFAALSPSLRVDLSVAVNAKKKVSVVLVRLDSI